MGQETSSPIDESVSPESLESRTLEAVAKYIKDGRAKRIVVMVNVPHPLCSYDSFPFHHFRIQTINTIVMYEQTGAGISTAAGIPDFRSPTTGLYANLARLNLPYPEAVFDISYFRQNPLPFYTLAHELYPGKFRPTITHTFVALLHKKGLLLKLFTQNIDCLEREAGVPGDKIVEAHGSFASQRCIDCACEFPDKEMRDTVMRKDVPHCTHCNGLVKPDIVFFGESLPHSFFENRGLPAQADLVIIMGTSLMVQPFASLPSFVSEGVPRVLINLEQAGSIGSRADDVLLLGDCDEQVRKLAAACGWMKELEEMWAATVPKAADQLGARKEEEDDKTKKREKTVEELLEEEVQKLTREVEETLKITQAHEEMVKDGLMEGEKSKDVKDNTEIAVSGIHGSGEGEGNEVRAPITEAAEEEEEGKQESSNSPDKRRKAKNELDVAGRGLEHVFPHLKGKSSL